jgi:hypothetical protein
MATYYKAFLVHTHELEAFGGDVYKLVDADPTPLHDDDDRAIEGSDYDDVLARALRMDWVANQFVIARIDMTYVYYQPDPATRQNA